MKEIVHSHLEPDKKGHCHDKRVVLQGISLWPALDNSVPFPTFNIKVFKQLESQNNSNERHYFDEKGNFHEKRCTFEIRREAFIIK